MILSFSDTGGRTDATHAALLTVHALQAMGEAVTVVRICAPHEIIRNPVTKGPVDFIVRSSAGEAVGAIADARDLGRVVVLDLPLRISSDPLLRRLISVPVLVVGPYEVDETAALALDAECPGAVDAAPTWFLGCRRSGSHAAFANSMSRGRESRLLPITLPPLTRAEATSLACGLPSTRALRNGFLLVSCLRALSADPMVRSIPGPVAAAARSEADRIALTVDERPFDERLRDLADALAAIGQGLAPTAEDLAAAPVLNDWSREIVPVPALRGTVGGHPSIGSGRLVCTSQVFASDNASWARTFSRLYALGRPASAGRAGRLQ